MKIILYSKERIIEFLLPLQVFGEYSFDEYDDIESKLINIEANDGQWYLNSTTGVKAFNNGNYSGSIRLEANSFYNLERDNIKYLIYVENLLDNTFKKYKYDNKLKLVVGNNKNSTLYYNFPLINGNLFSIKYVDNCLVLEKSNSANIYINKNVILPDIKKVNLRYGDIIEFFALKIIILKHIILINNPNNNLFVNKLTSCLDDFVLNVDNNFFDDEIKEINLYNDNDYFSKSPRIRRIIQNKTIKIDAPPSVKEDEDIPLIYTLGPMLTMGMTSSVNLANTFIRINNGETTVAESWTNLMIAGSMLCTTLLWPNLTKSFNKRQKKKKRKENIKKYRSYLDEKKLEISEEAKLQRDILIENLIPIDECYDIIRNKTVSLWSRRIEQEDFLNVRVGIGSYPLDLTINCPEESFSIDDTTLKKEAMSIAKEYEMLENVPVGYSFLKNTITAVMGSSMKVNYFVQNIILQLVTFHSYEDLKIVILTSKQNEKKWGFIKKLPHNFDNNKIFRFYSSNISDAKEISNYLEQEINYRRYDDSMNEVQRDYTQCKPYYLIITDNYSKIRNISVMKTLTEINNNYGFSMIILENKLSKLPSKCNNFISLGDKTSSILEDAYENQRIINFKDDIVYNLDMEYVGNRLFNIPIEFEKNNKMLPNAVTFLEMENVGKVEQLNILNRWKNNDPIKSLKAEVGIDESGDIMYLDLHEKYHGPHGLIAGMTGSGKSEFIITYVLSMALNYSPNEVSFILIDYKGGGLAGAFENKKTGIKLPHLAGTITNLDKAEMDRTLVSIDSEIRRRQGIFNDARDKLGESTIDIYKYQRFFREGRLEEPVPHLIIICDEFAELKSQQPDFMDNLISVARIGRSLGVHLILATQKPSGVVNDQIWSNSKFRVCLKVQEKSDSMEMLKRPEAAELKQVGRFYLQVGYNEMFALGQSGWCGAKYYPSDKVKKNVDKSVDFINDIGYVIKSIQGSNKNKIEAQGEELANVLGYIIDTAKRLNVFSRRLWLDNVPDAIFVDDLISKYDVKFESNLIEAIVGEYDNPSNQNQNILKINLNKDGNTIIFGTDGSDREMFIDSMIYSTTTRHNTDEINYYIVDFGSESLRQFIDYPHVGDMVFLGEDEKLNNLFKLINSTIKERKKKFSSYGGEYNNYIKNTGEKLPLIGIIVNNYDAFIDSNFEFDETLVSFTRDCLRYGIFFVLTANGDNSIRRKLKQNFNTILSLRLNDVSDYSSIFGRVNNYPKDIIGRGLVKLDEIYEFQTSMITAQDNNYVIKIGDKLKEINSYDVKRIPTLPDKVNYDYVEKYIENISSVPVGVFKTSLEPAIYDFTSYLSTFILSTTSENTAKFTKNLSYLLSKISNIQLIVVDINKEIPDVKNYIKYYYDNSPVKVIDMLIDYIKKIKDNQLNAKTIILFQNLNKFKMKLDNSKLDALSNEIKNTENINLIIADDYKKLKKVEYDTWYRNIQNDTDGIWIGTGIADQNLFKLSKITNEMGYVYKNNFGFVIKDGRSELFKTIDFDNLDGGDNNE